METDITEPHKNHNSKSSEKPTPYPRVKTETSTMPTIPQKLPAPQIGSPDPTSPQHITYRYRIYKTRALAALLATQSAPNHHVEIMTEKKRQNIFKAKMNI